MSDVRGSRTSVARITYMPTTPYDKDLLEAARGGNQDAILSLLAIAQPDIRRYAAQACRVSDDINDAVQEALWVLYRRIGTLRTITAFSRWLFAIVRRECLKLAQKVLKGKVDIKDIENAQQFSFRPQFELRIDLARAIQ